MLPLRIHPGLRTDHPGISGRGVDDLAEQPVNRRDVDRERINLGRR